MEKNLSCDEFETLLADWIDETLAAPERDAFVRHRDSCHACTSLLADATSAVAFIDRASDIEMPPALVSTILHNTNAGWEFKLRRQGISGWINRTFAPVLKPRVVMGALLTMMSMTMLTRCAPQKTMTVADLDPVRVWVALDNQAHRVWDRAVKSYVSMRLVYEVRNQIDDWTEQQREEAAATADADANKRRLPDPAGKEPGKQDAENQGNRK
jgi:hypothetical protein